MQLGLIERDAVLLLESCPTVIPCDAPLRASPLGVYQIGETRRRFLGGPARSRL